MGNYNGNYFLKIISGVIWLILGLVEALLVLRIIFELLNAQSVGFTNTLYNITSPFVTPFNNIFPAVHLGASFLDTAALVAIVVVALLGWVISALIGILSRP